MLRNKNLYLGYTAKKIVKTNNANYIPHHFSYANYILQCAKSPCYSTKLKTNCSVDSIGKSLTDKGFLRPYKPYTASEDVVKKVQAVCSAIGMSPESNYQPTSIVEKYKLLEACSKEFNHTVPNSLMHELSTVGDIMKFYETSVTTTTPLDSLVHMKLPENVHIQYDYVRFNAESDTKFNKQTAFPKSSTLVTGLKYRGKYQGNEAKRSWP